MSREWPAKPDAYHTGPPNAGNQTLVHYKITHSWAKMQLSPQLRCRHSRKRRAGELSYVASLYYRQNLGNTIHPGIHPGSGPA
jgi:hypothetical protein